MGITIVARHERKVSIKSLKQDAGLDEIWGELEKTVPIFSGDCENVILIVSTGEKQKI